MALMEMMKQHTRSARMIVCFILIINVRNQVFEGDLATGRLGDDKLGLNKGSISPRQWGHVSWDTPVQIVHHRHRVPLSQGVFTGNLILLQFSTCFLIFIWINQTLFYWVVQKCFRKLQQLPIFCYVVCIRFSSCWDVTCYQQREETSSLCTFYLS